MRAVRAAMVVLWALGGLLLVGGAVGASERNYQDVLDITFPTEEELSGNYINDYYQGRDSNDCGHRATDIMGPHGTEVYAAEGGEVTWLSEGSHYIIQITDDDGYRYRYMHLGRSHGPREEAFAPGIERGVEVERGEHIGYMGSSGNAVESAPHLHFEIHHQDLTDTPCRDNGWGYYNPYYSLNAAVERGDFAGSDLDEADPMPEHVGRVRGSTRIHTAAELAAAAFPDGADHVVVAPAYSFPEAIAAGPLASALDGPVITTGSEELHEHAADAIRSLDAEFVTIVGEFEVVGRSVADAVVTETQVHADDVTRLAGDGPAGTAAVVAAEVAERAGSDGAIVARGADPDQRGAWPDALTGGWYGAKTGAPVLLTTTDEVPETTVDALAAFDAATIVGGTAAVGEDVEDELSAHVDTLDRIAGDSRFSTAAALVDALFDDGAISSDRVWVATGDNYADALAAAPSVAADGAALTLVDGHDGEARDGLGDWFDQRREDFVTGRAVGGTAAISDDALRTLGERID